MYLLSGYTYIDFCLSRIKTNNIQDSIDVVFEKMSSVSFAEFVREVQNPTVQEVVVGKVRKERMPSVMEVIEGDLEQEFGCFV